jgi:hypothetical protein
LAAAVRRRVLRSIVPLRRHRQRGLELGRGAVDPDRPHQHAGQAIAVGADRDRLIGVVDHAGQRRDPRQLVRRRGLGRALGVDRLADEELQIDPTRQLAERDPDQPLLLVVAVAVELGVDDLEAAAVVEQAPDLARAILGDLDGEPGPHQVLVVLADRERLAGAPALAGHVGQQLVLGDAERGRRLIERHLAIVLGHGPDHRDRVAARRDAVLVAVVAAEADRRVLLTLAIGRRDRRTVGVRDQHRHGAHGVERRVGRQAAVGGQGAVRGPQLVGQVVEGGLGLLFG